MDPLLLLPSNYCDPVERIWQHGFTQTLTLLIPSIHINLTFSVVASLPSHPGSRGLSTDPPAANPASSSPSSANEGYANDKLTGLCLVWQQCSSQRCCTNTGGSKLALRRCLIQAHSRWDCAGSPAVCAGVGGPVGHLLGLWWVQANLLLLDMKLINPVGLGFSHRQRPKTDMGISPSTPAAWEIATAGQRGSLIDSYLTFIWTSHMLLNTI